MPPTHKICPKCQQYFQCNAANVGKCHCSTHPPITIAVTYDDCLCPKCLNEHIKVQKLNENL
ncbi:MAG: cysteine-rich CWC family protein [Brumimicrobium sp.]|nr:cysteine-rich CWC family protein [Brumimicrobium sp.]